MLLKYYLTICTAFYFILMLQVSAYILVLATYLVAQLRHLRTMGRQSVRSEKIDQVGEQNSLLANFLLGCKILLSSSIAGLAALCGATALMHCPNLFVLAALPVSSMNSPGTFANRDVQISTYVSDSLLSRTAYASRLLSQDQSISARKFYKLLFVIFCISPIICFDYRINIRGLAIAFAGFALHSLSGVVAKVGSRSEAKGAKTWDFHLQYYLMAGVAPMIVAWYATSHFENTVAASHRFGMWSITYKLANIGPGVLLYALFNSSMYSAFPFTSTVHVGGALEEPTEAGIDAVASTLQAAFWTIIVGVLGQEHIFIDWNQITALTLLYVVCVGPPTIGYYPPRLANLFSRIVRRRQLPIHAEPWQFAFFLGGSTLIFATLVSFSTIYWIDTIAYHRNMKTWHGPENLVIDNMYRPKLLQAFDIVIAHSDGDPISSISDLITTFTTHSSISGLNPRVTVYTKDPNFKLTNDAITEVRGDFKGDLSLQTLRPIGGATATMLHHILDAWNVMSIQTLFLSTTSNNPTTLPLHTQRLSEYFAGFAYPLPDALPKTGFLNLGEQEVCSCSACFDSLGWEDTFHQIPSMWSAARPGSAGCDSVLLTYGNNFIASAARIRGVKKDVWQTLFDGLINDDVSNAWAHKEEKMPVKFAGEEGKGRWAEGEVYGVQDSVARPWLGLTVERLWAVLLQCSSAEVAWGCPSLEVGTRKGGRAEDCGCIE